MISGTVVQTVILCVITIKCEWQKEVIYSLNIFMNFWRAKYVKVFSCFKNTFTGSEGSASYIG